MQTNATLPAVPRLLPDLRLALATLYSLPLDPSLARPSPSEAHEFLMQVQSRNARRRIIACHQQERDTQKKGLSNSNNTKLNSEIIPMGSSWLACLAILCQTHENGHFAASATERLFAAQTLHHRLRRVKLVEAIDLEMEFMQTDCTRDMALQCYRDDSHVVHLMDSYQTWMLHAMGGVAGAAVQSYTLARHLVNPTAQTRPPFTIQEEEQIKGELTLITLAAVSYCTALQHQHEQHQQQSLTSLTGPLLSTITATMATVSIKLRYSQHASHYPHTLMDLIQHAYQSVPGHPDPLAIRMARYACLSALPDTVLAGGTTQGRISIDPKLIQAAISDLKRVELPLVWQLLMQEAALTPPPSSGPASSHSCHQEHLWILTTCERWARYMPLSSECLQLSLPLLEKHLRVSLEQRHDDPHRIDSNSKPAWAYLLTLVESATWSVDQIVSSQLGLGEANQSHQASRKRQSSRSKKKKQQVIERESSEDIWLTAEQEIQHRGNVACQAVMGVWSVVHAVVQKDLGEYRHNTSLQVDGEGPVGCLSAIASACLPHILRQPSSQGLELLAAVTQDFQEICASPNKTVRAMALEPLHTLHKVLLEVIWSQGPLGGQLESLVIDHFCKVSSKLVGGLWCSCCMQSFLTFLLSVVCTEFGGKLCIP